MRPAGVGGVLLMLVIAWLAVALIALGALWLDRWNQLSYPDSLWLMVVIGVVSVSFAVGRVSRTERDADAWGAQALLVPSALLLVEILTGPSCPSGGNCAAIGARGEIGLFGSVLLIVLAAVTSWGVARWQQRAAAEQRPQHVRVRAIPTTIRMIALIVFPGALLAIGFVGLDMWLRSTPSLVASAQREVERECYGLLEAPQLAVRATAQGYNPTWTTFAVRRANESRPGIAKKPLPTDWAGLDDVYPYEATVSFNENQDVVAISCRRIGPGTGNATADDLKQTPPENNPLSPKTTGSQFLPRFFVLGVAGPTPEGTKLLADKQKAEAKKSATKDDTKADAKDDAAK